jgi:hypothetical protein
VVVKDESNARLVPALGTLALVVAGLSGCSSELPARCDDGPFNCPAEWAAWPMRTTPAPYTTTTDTATDTRSQLMWQRVAPSAMQSWSQAGDYCEELTLGGHSDWRLPSRIELLTLVDYPTGAPAQTPSTAPVTTFGEALIDRSAFANTAPTFFWTASNYVEDDSLLSTAWPGDDVAWTVDFGTGLVEQQHVELLLPRTRCVRDTRTAPSAASRYVVTSDTVSETATGLTWERALSYGSYEEAQRRCASLTLGGSAGFRLPHVKEAMTIASALSDAQPCLDASAFKLPTGFFYGGLWTSTLWSGKVEPGQVASGEQRLTVNLSARGKLSHSGTAAATLGTPKQYALCVREGSAPRGAASLEGQP